MEAMSRVLAATSGAPVRNHAGSRRPQLRTPYDIMCLALSHMIGARQSYERLRSLLMRTSTEKLDKKQKKKKNSTELTEKRDAEEMETTKQNLSTTSPGMSLNKHCQGSCKNQPTSQNGSSHRVVHRTSAPGQSTRCPPKGKRDPLVLPQELCDNRCTGTYVDDVRIHQ